MADEILVFGAIGTQIVLDRRIYEIVALGGNGAVTWRGRCSVCHGPIFAEVKAGKLPTRSRCNQHLNSNRHPEVPLPHYQVAAEIAELERGGSPATIKVRDFVPETTQEYVRNRITPVEVGKQIVGQARGAIVAQNNLLRADGAQPLQGFVRMHLPDEDQTTVEANIGSTHELTKTNGALDERPISDGDVSHAEGLGEDPYSVAALSAELDELAPEGDEEPPPPSSDEDLWMPRLATFYRDRMWLPSWGNRPDQANCQAPDELLARFRRR